MIDIQLLILSIVEDPMQTQITYALKLSLVPDSQSIKAATAALNALAKNQGYCFTLMQIVDDDNEQIFIRQGALTQLKNTLKKYWECASTQHQITTEEKSQILNSLLSAFIRAASNQMLVKLYRQVVVTIIGFEYKNWFPLNSIIEYLNKNQEVPQVLQFVIGICTNFEFSMNQEEQTYYYQFILNLLPVLFSIVQNTQDSEIIYSIIKIIWKTVHYDISDEVRKVIANGMDLVIAVAGAANPQFETNFDEFQNKGTQQFFYFHAKKWATRILYRFIFRHANSAPSYTMSQEVKQSNKQFSQMWYDAYGQKVVETLVNQFQISTIKKIRYFQLKCIEGLIKSHPQVMRAYAQAFQYKILPQYIKLTPEDEELANNDPLEFFNKEDDPTINYTNLKSAATEVWIAFVQLGSKKKSKGKASEVGEFFFDNLNYLKSKLEGSDMLEKEMAMYLICQLRWTISKNKQFSDILPNLISQFVVPQFTNEIMFLRARAVQIFSNFGDLKYSEEILKKAVEGIYFCLTGDTYQLVRIKAATAFHVLLNHELARELVKPLFQSILQVYLDLIEKYDLELLVHSLSSIVEHFSVEVGPFSCELVSYLCRHFIKLYHRDNEQSKQNDYDGQTQLAAAGILNTIKTIIESPLDGEIVEKMQADILPICEFIFGADDSDYTEDVLFLLRAYTFKVKRISQNLLFFYVISIYYVIGIPEKYWSAIPNLNASDERKKALQNIKKGCNIQSFQSVMPLLRNFISKDSELLFRVNDMFGNNLLELIFNMTNQIYQNGPNQYDGEIEMNNCTILMIYLIENNLKKWNDMIINHIWEVAYHNLCKAKSKILTSLTAQLFCVLVWNCPEYVIMKAHQTNVLAQAILFILNSEHKIREEHERQRLVFGISEMLALNEKPGDLYQNCGKLFNLVLKLVKKNAELRVNESADENYETESDQQQELEKLILGEDEPEDIWDQDFSNNFQDKIDEVDEIKHFKTAMENIQNKDSNFYGQLIQSVPQDQLIHLDTLMTKAIQSLQ